MLKCAVKYCKPGQLCQICETSLRCPDCGHSDGEGCGCPPWVKEIREKYKMKQIPELYPENLDTLKHIMARMDLFGRIDGVFEVEVRVRIDDVDSWAVIGYGMAGDPCVLRFE